ncbi:ethylbenzene dehydrogenase-related protein [Balneolales bacterium ANBcel1]|nr:ethylbenzene dehydrogenase-related protein [Balneolales bacterium ANBcel1]
MLFIIRIKTSVFFTSSRLSGLALILMLALTSAGCEDRPDRSGSEDIPGETGSGAPGEAFSAEYDTPALAPSSPLYVDHDRNVYIPAKEDLVRSLDVAFTYNRDSVRVHFRYATDRPSWYHQYLVYEDGTWNRYGSGGQGPDVHGLYEDRFSMMLDDGSVEGFAEIGGFVTVHPGMRSMTDAASAQEVEAHPHLGETMGRSDVRKYIRESREQEMDGGHHWAQVRPQDELDELREKGAFLDLWQWRAHRSNPLGYADNGYVLDYRHGSEGTSMYTDNTDDTGQPRYMFDVRTVNRHALRKDSLVDRLYTQDDPYFLYKGNAAPFDPDIDWQDGDALPHRFLREPEGSRGALKANGYWSEGYWNISITRTLDAPGPIDSKPIADGNSYNVAFAVHTDGAGARWHYVSVPYRVAFRDPDNPPSTQYPDANPVIQARYTDGPLHEADPEWYEIPVFYPGQVDLSWLENAGHPGHHFVRDGSMHMLQIHDLELLSTFIVRHELEMLGLDPEAFGISTELSY